MNNPYTPQYVDELSIEDLKRMLGIKEKKKAANEEKRRAASALARARSIDIDLRFKRLDAKLSKSRR